MAVEVRSLGFRSPLSKESTFDDMGFIADQDAPSLAGATSAVPRSGPPVS